MHTLALCVFKKYVHMLVKYVEGNGKIKDLDGVLQNVWRSWVLSHLEQDGLGVENL
jgi:hypothetical protein